MHRCKTWHVLLLVLLSSSVCHAGWFDDWDTGDRLLLAGYSAAWFLDYGQTREIAVNDDYTEGNAWLGKHPSQDDVNAYFIGKYLFDVFIADTLDGWWRKGWLAYVFYVHADAAIGNKRIGLSVNFEF